MCILRAAPNAKNPIESGTGILILKQTVLRTHAQRTNPSRLLPLTTLSANALRCVCHSLTVVMIERAFVGCVALYVEGVAPLVPHSLFECPFTHTPILVTSAPIRLSGHGAKVLTPNFFPNVFQAHVVRPCVSTVHAALSVASVSCRWHTRFAAPLQGPTAHGHIRVDLLHSFQPPRPSFFLKDRRGRNGAQLARRVNPFADLRQSARDMRRGIL